MPGLAKTTQFMLGSATVMLGVPAEIDDFKPDTHSIGLVKNFQINAEPQTTDLTQGVQNTLVFSQVTANPIRASMEVFEYTAKNLNFALGLDGSAVVPTTALGAIASPSAGASADITLGVGEGTNFANGDWITIEGAVGSEDFIYTRQILSKASDVLTLSVALVPVIPAGAVVKKVNVVDIGSKANQPFLAAKVVGQLANGESVILDIPKMKITRGFTLQFGTDDYGNLPFEFSIFDLVSGDPKFSQFGNIPVKLYKVS